MDHAVIGPAIRQALELGRKEGRKEVYSIVKKLLEKRFGPIPAWVEPRLSNLSPSHNSELAVSVFSIGNVEDEF